MNAGVLRGCIAFLGICNRVVLGLRSGGDDFLIALYSSIKSFIETVFNSYTGC